jgi:hypothetical protein
MPAGREETPELEEGELPPGDVESGTDEPAAAVAKAEDDDAEEDAVSPEPFPPMRSAPRTPERTPEQLADDAAAPAAMPVTEAPVTETTAGPAEGLEADLRKLAGASAARRAEARTAMNEPTRTASKISFTTDWDPSEDMNMNESEHGWSREVSMEMDPRATSEGELATYPAPQDAYTEDAEGDRDKDGEESEELTADSWELEASAYGLDIMEAALGEQPDDDDTQDFV